MNAPQGTFDFPGVLSPLDGKYNCNHGISPGRILLRAAYQSSDVLNVGPLRITYGSQSFDVRDCKVVERIDYYDSGGGWVSEFLLEDRRWRWRFGEIEGSYNTKLKNGKLDESCERTPHELAKLLFEAMKERRYDFNELPNAPRPEFRWVGANPAQELERLADTLGCRVAYDPVSDSVSIRKTGQGGLLPDINSVDQISSNLFRPATPSGIRVVGAPTRFQMAVPLVSVVEDLNGEFEFPSDLSYAGDLASDTGRSETDWYYAESLEFENISDKRQRALVKKSMWKYWKPILGGDEEKKIADYLTNQSFTPTLSNKIVIRNVSLSLNREYTPKNQDEENFGEQSTRGFIAGVFATKQNDQGPLKAPDPGAGVHKNTSTSENNTVYTGSVSIDNSGDSPLVITGDPIFEWDEAFGEWIKIRPSQLYLICTFEVRQKGPDVTCSTHHYNYYQQLSNEVDIVGPEVVQENSLQLKPYEQFDVTTLKRVGLIADNVFVDGLNTKAQDIVLNRAQRYVKSLSGNASYQELVLARMDGAIQSIVWSFGERGATTEIYRNSEPDFLETKYDRRVRDSEIARKAGVTWP